MDLHAGFVGSKVLSQKRLYEQVVPRVVYPLIRVFLVVGFATADVREEKLRSSCVHP